MVSDLHPFSLNFRGERASLEKEYRNDNIRSSLNRIRSALILVTFLYGFFGFLDNRMSPEEKELMWLIRFLIVVPCALIVLYLTYRPLFLKYSQHLLLALCLIGALGIIAITAFSTSSASYSYYAGLILIIITIHTYLQMRFLWGGSCTLLIVLAYEVINYLYIRPPRLIFYNNQFFFLSSALICLAAGYINEVNVRIRYLSELLLKEEKEKVLGQKRKMEILGTISSGIAHDFNNMLTALQGYTELSLNETDSDSPVHAYQEEVLAVARRAQAVSYTHLTLPTIYSV